MQTGSKILVIEDDRNDFQNIFLEAYSRVGLMDEQSLQDIKDLRPEQDEEDLDLEQYCQKLKDYASNIVVPSSFKDAFALIQDAKCGEEYEWFFIDRDLNTYSDVNTASNVNTATGLQIGEKTFGANFFAGFAPYLGDYFAIMLLNANVPIEKICFLTNNDGADVSISPYLHNNKIPETIIKDRNNLDPLTKKLRHSHRAKIRFLYRDIFDNNKVKAIFSPYLEHFIAILARRYSGKMYTPSCGITLRLMIEAVVKHIADTYHFANDPNFTCRNLLNYFKREYNFFPDRKKHHKLAKKFDRHILTHWVNTFDTLKHLPEQKDQNDIEKLLNTDAYYQNAPKKVSKHAKSIIELSNTIRTLYTLNLFYNFYFGQSNNLPPKYIFSYIDNIYTVTSEWSAHGRNAQTTNDLTKEGWEALLNGMLQILQWVAKENPNPTT